MSETVKTICQMCYFYCGLDVTVENGRIERVEGMREHPVSGGRLCPKGLACADLVTDPQRLRTPLRRVGDRGSGRWQAVSWGEALDVIAAKMLSIREHSGPEYVGYYRGHAPGWITNYSHVLRFMDAWESPNIFTHGHLCHSPRAMAQTATYGGVAEPDYERTQCMALFGYNPAATSPVNHAARVIRAKERGAKLIVVDPRFTNTAAKADLYLQPRPGTTGALVLAMIHVLVEENLYDAGFVAEWTTGFDRLKILLADYAPEGVEQVTWVPAAKIAHAARMLASTRPAVIVDGNGLDQHTNAVQTARTISILRSLLRTIDEPGGSILVPPLPPTYDRENRAPDSDAKAMYHFPLYYRANMTMSGVDLMDSLAPDNTHRLEMLIVQGGNPVAVLSDTNHARERLQTLDMLVVHDLYLTATAQLADLVLPAASFLERDLVLYYRYRPAVDTNLIAMQNQCVPPVGESKSDMDCILALAHRLGLHKRFPWANPGEALDAQLRPLGISVAWLREHPAGYVERIPAEALYRKYQSGGYATASRKIEIVASRFAEFGYDPLPRFVEPATGPVSSLESAEDYPLVGSAGLKLGIHTHSQFHALHSLRDIEPDPLVEIHPETAAELGICEGDWVVVESPRGSVRVRARLRATGHPRVIFVAFGYGEPYAGGGKLANELTSDAVRDPITGSTENRSFLCRIAKVEA